MDGTNYFFADLGGFVQAKDNLSMFAAGRKDIGGDGPMLGWSTSGLVNTDACDLEGSDDVRFFHTFSGTNLTVDLIDVAPDETLFTAGYISDPDFTAYSKDTIAFGNSAQITSGITDPSGNTYGSNTNIVLGRTNSTTYWGGGRFYGAIMGVDIFTDNTDTAEVLALVNGTNEYLAWLTGTTYSEIGSIT